jgi:hypothetical protein
MRRCACRLAVVIGVVAASLAAPPRAAAQTPPGGVATQDGRATADGGPILSAANPLQCWWRTSAGAIRLGEVFDVTLTCAVLDTPAERVVADEARLAVAAVQLAPFEIVDGGRAPDVRSGDRRFIQYRYRLRLINFDAIGRDVKLPPLTVSYRLESRPGAAASVGREQTHVLPQIAIRVVSQVPADAEDIRDSSDASLARIDATRFRATAFNLAGWALAAIAAVAALSVLAPALGLLGRRRQRPAAGTPDRVVLAHAARVLDERLQQARGAGWTPEALAEAHGAARLVAAVALGVAPRETVLSRDTAAPEGRIRVPRRFGTQAVALTAHVTAHQVAHASEALPPDASAATRSRLEQLKDALTALTRGQYGAAAGQSGTAIDEAVASVRDVARDLARERLWSPRAWIRRPAPAAVSAPEF